MPSSKVFTGCQSSAAFAPDMSSVSEPVTCLMPYGVRVGSKGLPGIIDATALVMWASRNIGQ